MNHQSEHLHFLGIAGHAMRGVALAAKKLGYRVSGTDEGAYEPGVSWLREQGVSCWSMADISHLKGVTGLIISGHVPADHLELIEAQKRGIPTWSYPELVDKLTGGERRIVVAGTHGKTSTTALITWILDAAGRKPDFVIGIKPHNFDSSVRLSGSKVVVIEGDEYRASQLDERSKFDYYHPDVLVLTSIEHDHPDLFADLAAVSDRFMGLVTQMTKGQRVYYWHGSPTVRAVVEQSKANTESYDLTDADWEARDVRYLPEGLAFNLVHRGKELGELALPLFGEHNVLNVLAAAAVAIGEGIEVTEIRLALKRFKGASRRFERVSDAGAAVTVLDDYAHHPTEVKTTIEAVRLHNPGGRVIAVFRPHTYSRTLSLLKEYQQAFNDADLAFIADIEGARERHLESTVSGADIAAGADDKVIYEPDRAKLMDEVVKVVRPGDTVLVMTVNGYERFAQELVEHF